MDVIIYALLMLREAWLKRRQILARKDFVWVLILIGGVSMLPFLSTIKPLI